MADSPNQQTDSSDKPNDSGYYPNYQPSPIEANWWIMLGLISMGVLLVLFADPRGVSLVKEHLAPGRYGWSADKAREVALSIRCVGGMCFAAGLVERVIIQIAKLKT